MKDDRFGPISITSGTFSATPSSGLSLLFPAGQRPAGDDILRLVKNRPEIASQFGISHFPKTGEGWLELLANGLTFDLNGLAPDPPGEAARCVHRYGFPADPGLDLAEAITLRPGAHLAGGGNLMPVVRSMAAIAAALAHLPGVTGVVWHPARCVMEPAYFARIVAGWLGGGPFPALGLTALVLEQDGGIRSDGLAFFTGQELRIDPIVARNPATAGKIAIRLIHSLISGWSVQTSAEIAGPDGQRLGVEPVDNGRVLRIWKAH